MKIYKAVTVLFMMFAITVSGVEPELKYSELDKSAENEFFDAFKKCVENVKTLKVSFTQERYMSIFTGTLAASGKCSFKHPDKLRWEISAPYKSILVYNGDSLAKFDFDNGVYRKMNSGNYDMLMDVLAQISSWMRGDFAQTAKIYSLSVFKGENEFMMKLIPRSFEMRKILSSVELHIRNTDYHISRVVIRENAEDYITINFSGEKINAGFSDDFFNTEELKEK